MLSKPLPVHKPLFFWNFLKIFLLNISDLWSAESVDVKPMDTEG